LSFFTFAFAAFNSLYLAPAAENKITSVIEAAQADAGIATLIEGHFHRVAEKGSVIYVEKYESGKKLKKIFLAYWPTTKGNAPFVLTALSGKAENRKDGTWVTLQNGQRYAGIIGQHEFDNSKFERFGVHIVNSVVQNKKRDVNALSTLALLEVNNPKYQTELQWRIAIPLSILFLTFVAVPMARVNPREGRYSKLFSAIALYLLFFLLLSTAKSFMDDGSMPIFSIWVVQIIFLGFGCFLHMRSIGKLNRKQTSKVMDTK
jgi:lipopolysaccharide export system permease protein